MAGNSIGISHHSAWLTVLEGIYSSSSPFPPSFPMYALWSGRERFPAPAHPVLVNLQQEICRAALSSRSGMEHTSPRCVPPFQPPIGVCPPIALSLAQAMHTQGNLTRGCSAGAGRSCAPGQGQRCLCRGAQSTRVAAGFGGGGGGSWQRCLRACRGAGLALRHRTRAGAVCRFCCAAGDGCPSPH